MYNGQQNQQYQYGMQQNQGVQLVSQLYQLDQIQQNFNFSIGTQYQEIEMASPQICKGVAYEIQTHVNNGSPVRINLFNFISENAFANAQFQNLAGVVIARVTLGMINKEFNSIINAGDVVIRNLVRWFGAYIAVQNPAVMQCLSPEIANAVSNDARLWEKQAQMVANQVPFEPFASMQLSQTLGNVNSTWGGNGGDMNSGAFVPAGSRSMQNNNSYITNGNDGLTNTDGLDRFQRQMLRRQNRLQGSIQTALIDSGASGFVDQEKQDQYAEAAKLQQEKIARRNSGNAVQSFAAVVGTPAPAPAPAPEQPPVVQEEPMAEIKDFAFSIEADGVTYGVVRQLTEKECAAYRWKPNSTQMVHPAWDRTADRLVYLEIENGDIIAAIVRDENKMHDSDLFKYEAHAIDPTMGIPDDMTPQTEDIVAKDTREPKSSPVTRSLRLNVITPAGSPAVATLDSIEHTTVLKATSLESTPDAYFQQASVVDVVSYATREQMLCDLETICGFAVASDWTTLVEMIGRIESDKTKKAIDRRLTNSVNDWLKYQLGSDITIDSFIEDAPVSLINALEEIYGAIIVKAIKRDSSMIVRAACQVSDGADNTSVINNLYGTDGVGITTDKMLVLMQDCAVVWVSRTDGDIGIGLPDGGSGSISERHTPYVDTITKACFNAINAGNLVNHITLITKDGIRYRLSKSAVSPDTHLMRKL